MPSGTALWTGDAVEEGEGPIRCSARRANGRLCLGLLGWPAVGSVLADRLELARGEYLRACEPGLSGFRCPECGAVAVFSVPGVAAVGGGA